MAMLSQIVRSEVLPQLLFSSLGREAVQQNNDRDVVLSVFEFFAEQGRPGLLEVRWQHDARPVEPPQFGGERAGLLERAFLGRGCVRRLPAAPEPREVIDYFLPVCYAAVQQQED